MNREHGQRQGGQPLGGGKAHQQTQDQGDDPHNARLQEQNQRHLALAQAQEQVGAQLPLPAAEQKVVGVENQAGQHHRHKHGKHVHHDKNRCDDGVSVLAEKDHGGLAVQGVEGIEQPHAEGEGEQVDPVVPEGPAHVACGKLTKHLPSLLPAVSPPG